MGDGKRPFITSTSSVESWWDFIIGAVAFLAIAGAFEYANSTSPHAAGLHALDALGFAVKLLAAALIGAGLLWLGIRAVKGEGAPDLKDTLLWNASLIGSLVIGLRMIR
jgi:CDP-diglyceride synthetase